MRLIGHLLLWTGFLAGAFAAVVQLENEANKWATIPWISYAGALAIGVVGIVILRTTAKMEALDDSKTEAGFNTLETSMDQLVTAVKELILTKDKLTPGEIVAFIDDRFIEPFAEFADARHALSSRYGLQFYADVMTPFASAERYINRSWSAAADGYVDEVDRSLKLAQDYLTTAQSMIDKAQKESAGQRM